MKKPLKTLSQETNYTPSGDGPTLDEVNLGTLQRIADALEKQNEILIQQNNVYGRLYNIESKQRILRRDLNQIKKSRK